MRYCPCPSHTLILSYFGCLIYDLFSAYDASDGQSCYVSDFLYFLKFTSPNFQKKWLRGRQRKWRRVWSTWWWLSRFGFGVPYFFSLRLWSRRIPVERVYWNLLYVPYLRLSRPLWELSPEGCLRQTLIRFLGVSLLIPALRGLWACVKLLD